MEGGGVESTTKRVDFWANFLKYMEKNNYAEESLITENLSTDQPIWTKYILKTMSNKTYKVIKFTRNNRKK